MPFRQLRPEVDEVLVYGVVVDRLYELRRIRVHRKKGLRVYLVELRLEVLAYLEISVNAFRVERVRQPYERHHAVIVRIRARDRAVYPVRGLEILLHENGHFVYQLLVVDFESEALRREHLLCERTRPFLHGDMRVYAGNALRVLARYVVVSVCRDEGIDGSGRDAVALHEKRRRAVCAEDLVYDIGKLDERHARGGELRAHGYTRQISYVPDVQYALIGPNAL